MRYAAEGVRLLVIAGKEYGSGSSRDWAGNVAPWLPWATPHSAWVAESLTSVVGRTMTTGHVAYSAHC